MSRRARHVHVFSMIGTESRMLMCALVSRYCGIYLLIRLRVLMLGMKVSLTSVWDKRKEQPTEGKRSANDKRGCHDTILRARPGDRSHLQCRRHCISDERGGRLIIRPIRGLVMTTTSETEMCGRARKHPDAALVVANIIVSDSPNRQVVGV